MKKLLTTGLAMLTLVSSVTPAQAWCCRKCCPPPCCDVCVTYVDKVVTCYKPAWQERDVTCTVNKLVPREVVTQQTCTVLTPVFSDVKKVCTIMTKVPRVVEKQVTCCRMVPVTCTDPCTGCTYTSCKPESYVQTVQCTVYDCVPVQKEYTARVCSFKPETRTYEKRCTVYDCVPETVVKKQRYCVMVPYQTVVKVPVCTPVCCK